LVISDLLNPCWFLVELHNLWDFIVRFWNLSKAIADIFVDNSIANRGGTRIAEQTSAEEGARKCCVWF
jgi:hypothetical protein